MGKPVILAVVFSVLVTSVTTAEDATNRTPQEVSKSLGMKFRLIPDGEFLMGSPKAEKERKGDERQHLVKIADPFYLGEYEVLRREFAAFVEDTRYQTESERDGRGAWGYDDQTDKFQFDLRYNWRTTGLPYADDHPVVNVTWNDAIAFCNWLSRKEGRPDYYRIEGETVRTNGNDSYRLPTEREWEYACRAGTTTSFQSGDDPEGLATVGNVADGSARSRFPSWTEAIQRRDGYAFTAPAGRFKVNAFGIYDMHGNVSEWCSDWYDENFLEIPDDGRDPGSGAGRTVRGGGYSSAPAGSRSAFRMSQSPNERDTNLGFRLARSSRR